MLLHEALRRHSGTKQVELFVDEPDATFSIHNICQEGISLGKKPGEWYGPQTTLNALTQLNKRLRPFPKFKILTCHDGNIFFDKIERKIKKG